MTHTTLPEEIAEKTVPATPWGRRLAALDWGTRRTHAGLSVFPLLGENDGALRYVLLDVALAAGTVTVEEKGASGSVPEIWLSNTGALPLLVVDGEELIGAKQNRIVNTSVLVGTKTAIGLPVSCVEAGRWNPESAQFRSEGTQYNARGRQKKVTEVSHALATAGRATADQGRVWSDVDAKLSRLSVGSETRALHDAVRGHAAGLAAFVDALARPAPRQVGAVFALGHEIIGLDIFDQAETLAALLPKLVASNALDALDEQPAAAPPTAALVARWLNTIANASGDHRPAVALGQDYRLSASRVSGAALVIDEAALHVSAFWTNAQPAEAKTGRMERASVRRPVE